MTISISPLPLPHDIMWDTLKMLPLQQVLTCTRVSKWFKAIIDTEPFLNDFQLKPTKKTFKFIKKVLNDFELEKDIAIPKTKTARDKVLKKLFALVFLSSSYETWQGPPAAVWPVESMVSQFQDFYEWTYVEKHRLPDWRRVHYELENFKRIEWLPSLRSIDRFAMKRLRVVGNQWSKALGLKLLSEVKPLPVLNLYFREYALTPDNKNLLQGIWKFNKFPNDDEWNNILSGLADKGNPEAHYMVKSYELAAAKGHIGAMCLVGQVRDPNRWLEQACLAGFPPAYWKYARSVLDIYSKEYVYKDWTTKEIDNAIYYLMKSIAENHYARALLGSFFIKGKFMKRDFERGFYWLKKAKKEDLAHYQMGRCFELGRGVERDQEKAIERYNQALNEPKANYRLGVIAEESHDLKAALDFYENAIVLNSNCPKYLLAKARVLIRQANVLSLKADTLKRLKRSDSKNRLMMKRFAQEGAGVGPKNESGLPKLKRQKTF